MCNFIQQCHIYHVIHNSMGILAYIDQPLQARKPVGYQRDFIEAYVPNKSWYLSGSLRSQLHSMGKAVKIDASAGTYSRALLNLHSALAENLLPNPSDEGRIRQHAVDIGKSVYRRMSGPTSAQPRNIWRSGRNWQNQTRCVWPGVISSNRQSVRLSCSPSLTH